MNSKDLIKAGKLSEARKQLVEEIKLSPADVGKRTLLFQVYAFYGEWDKAEKQLDMIATQEPGRETGVQVYKNLILAERERREVYNTGRRPSFLPKTPVYFEMYSIACEKLAEEKIDEAKELFDQISSQIPVISGTLNGKSFTGFKDTDVFLSFFLEIIIHERYVLIPFESIRELSISPPKTLFDLLWVPASITNCDGLTLKCYLPVLYPDSFCHQDDRVKLGRMTDWTPVGGPFSKGSGQHVFQVGEEEVALLEIEVIFNCSGPVENADK